MHFNKRSFDVRLASSKWDKTWRQYKEKEVQRHMLISETGF
jgi:hypothetical protein